MPEISSKIAELGGEVRTGTPAEFAVWMTKAIAGMGRGGEGRKHPDRRLTIFGIRCRAQVRQRNPASYDIPPQRSRSLLRGFPGCDRRAGFSLAGQLSVGTAAAMGPGYVPRGLAILIMIYGLVLGVRARCSGRQSFPEIAWRPLLLLSASVALFAILLPLVGLALSRASRSWSAQASPPTTCGCARMRCWRVALAAFAVLLFVKVLGLPIPVWPW